MCGSSKYVLHMFNAVFHFCKNLYILLWCTRHVGINHLIVVHNDYTLCMLDLCDYTCRHARYLMRMQCLCLDSFLQCTYSNSEYCVVWCGVHEVGVLT